MSQHEWSIINGRLEQNYLFTTFARALAFVQGVGTIAEELNHHPDILLHDYNDVRVTTYTHAAKAVTHKDHELAARIDRLAQDFE